MSTMEGLTHAENADMHYMYGRANSNGTNELGMYQAQFPDRRVPNHKIFQCYIFNFVKYVRFKSPDMMLVNEELCQVIYSQFGLAIHQNDHQARRRFVEWAQNEIAVVLDFHKRILFSDEAHFWLNGYVNKQNCRIWSEATPQVYVETPLHPEKLTVWCALWAGGILLQKRSRPQSYSQW
ncbi:hypothetical protein TNCV_2169031 [Trichonephila clavipes]|nr:hypothetical protein TNCV_2169031 [Trichonephila clavipes]